jgi:hypothetical protein
MTTIVENGDAIVLSKMVVHASYSLPWIHFAVFLKYFGGWPNNDNSDYFGVKPRMNAN